MPFSLCPGPGVSLLSAITHRCWFPAACLYRQMDLQWREVVLGLRLSSAILYNHVHTGILRFSAKTHKSMPLLRYLRCHFQINSQFRYITTVIFSEDCSRRTYASLNEVYIYMYMRIGREQRGHVRVPRCEKSMIASGLLPSVCRVARFDGWYLRDLTPTLCVDNR